MLCLLDLLPLLQDVPSLIPKKCVRVQAILWPLDYLLNPLTRMVDLPTDRPHSSCHRSGDSCSSFLVAGSSLHSETEPEDELDAALFPETRCASGPNNSCGSAVGDELLPELTDKPGTTRGTKLFVLQIKRFPIVGQSWLLTADPLVRVSVVFAKLPY